MHERAEKRTVRGRSVYAGHENRVKENLERRIETMGLHDFSFSDRRCRRKGNWSIKMEKKSINTEESVQRLSFRADDHDGMKRGISSVTHRA